MLPCISANSSAKSHRLRDFSKAGKTDVISPSFAIDRNVHLGV